MTQAKRANEINVNAAYGHTMKRRAFLQSVALVPIAAAIPAAAVAEIAPAIVGPTPEAWVAAYNAACRQALQDIALYGRSALCLPEGGLPYVVDPLSLMRGEPA